MSNQEGGMVEGQDLTEKALKYKYLIGGLIIGIIAGIFSYGFVKSSKTEELKAYSEQLYIIEKNNLNSYVEGKANAGDISSKLLSSVENMSGYEGAVPTLVKFSDAFIAKGDLKNAKPLLEKGLAISKESYVKYLVAVRLSATQEDLGDLEGAIKTLDTAQSTGVKLLESKVYLDYGRLFLKTGNKEKAKSSFEWVVKNTKDSEFKKMATIYLEQL